MQLVIDAQGTVHTLYDESLDLRSLGPAVIRRASHVEPDADGQWWAEILGGPRLGPFERRSAALAAEVAWLESRAMLPPAPPVGSLARPFLLVLLLSSCLPGCRRADVDQSETAQPGAMPEDNRPRRPTPGVSGDFRGLTTDYFSPGGSQAPQP